jgi:hypothetical protein
MLTSNGANTPPIGVLRFHNGVPLWWRISGISSSVTLQNWKRITADGQNGCYVLIGQGTPEFMLVHFDSTGTVDLYRSYDFGGSGSLFEPSDIDMLPNGHVCITGRQYHSSGNCVGFIEIQPDGAVVADHVYGPVSGYGLWSTQLLPGGDMLSFEIAGACLRLSSSWVAQSAFIVPTISTPEVQGIWYFSAIGDWSGAIALAGHRVYTDLIWGQQTTARSLWLTNGAPEDLCDVDPVTINTITVPDGMIMVSDVTNNPFTAREFSTLGLAYEMVPTAPLVTSNWCGANGLPQLQSDEPVYSIQPCPSAKDGTLQVTTPTSCNLVMLAMDGSIVKELRLVPGSNLILLDGLATGMYVAKFVDLHGSVLGVRRCMLR